MEKSILFVLVCVVIFTNCSKKNDSSKVHHDSVELDTNKFQACPVNRALHDQFKGENVIVGILDVPGNSLGSQKSYFDPLSSNCHQEHGCEMSDFIHVHAPLAKVFYQYTTKWEGSDYPGLKLSKLEYHFDVQKELTIDPLQISLNMGDHIILKKVETSKAQFEIDNISIPSKNISISCENDDCFCTNVLSKMIDNGYKDYLRLTDVKLLDNLTDLEMSVFFKECVINNIKIVSLSRDFLFGPKTEKVLIQYFQAGGVIIKASGNVLEKSWDIEGFIIGNSYDLFHNNQSKISYLDIHLLRFLKENPDYQKHFIFARWPWGNKAGNFLNDRFITVNELYSSSKAAAYINALLVIALELNPDMSYVDGLQLLLDNAKKEESSLMTEGVGKLQCGFLK